MKDQQLRNTRLLDKMCVQAAVCVGGAGRTAELEGTRVTTLVPAPAQTAGCVRAHAARLERSAHPAASEGDQEPTGSCGCSHAGMIHSLARGGKHTVVMYPAVRLAHTHKPTLRGNKEDYKVGQRPVERSHLAVLPLCVAMTMP